MAELISNLPRFPPLLFYFGSCYECCSPFLSLFSALRLVEICDDIRHVVVRLDGAQGQEKYHNCDSSADLHHGV